jgi:hypothetical protein
MPFGLPSYRADGRTRLRLEERLVAMIERYSSAGEQPAESTKPSLDTNLINGSHLDGATGHASQHNIDAMFA